MALGNFDGVHQGHQTILKNCITTAAKKEWMAAVYTFDPHPAKILSPKTMPPLIQTLDQKLACLEKTGVEAVIVEKFDPAFSKLTPKQFLDEILLRRLHTKGIWVGYDFTFGVKRSGNIETLKTFCKKEGLHLHVTGAQFEKETLVSSTQIRQLIGRGQVDLAAEFLGRPFTLIGEVVRGEGIGGEMGIHTANLKVENELLPRIGIYATRSTIHACPPVVWRAPRLSAGSLAGSTKEWPSATSVGFNPTFPGKGFSVETHLIGFEGNLVGQRIEVAFLKWLRNELTFPNAETLAVQIQKDISEALKINETLRHHR